MGGSELRQQSKGGKVCTYMPYLGGGRKGGTHY